MAFAQDPASDGVDDDGPASTGGVSTDDGGGWDGDAAGSWHDQQDDSGSTDSVTSTTPEDRPGEDPGPDTGTGGDVPGDSTDSVTSTTPTNRPDENPGVDRDADLGDTDSVYGPTPEERPNEDPQDDPGNATDDGESVNVTDPTVDDPVDTYDPGQDVPQDVTSPETDLGNGETLPGTNVPIQYLQQIAMGNPFGEDAPQMLNALWLDGQVQIEGATYEVTNRSAFESWYVEHFGEGPVRNDYVDDDGNPNTDDSPAGGGIDWSTIGDGVDWSWVEDNTPGGDLAGLATWLKVGVAGALFVGVMWVLRPLFQIGAGVTD